MDDRSDPRRLIQGRRGGGLSAPFFFGGNEDGRVDRLNHRATRTPHFVRRLRWFLVAFALVAFVASAAYETHVLPASTGWVASGRNANGTINYVQKTEWAANFFKNTPGGGAAAATEFRTTVGALSSSTLGGLARKAIRGGVYGAAVGLAVEGIVNGAGWAINELRNQVLVPGTPQQPLGEVAYCLPVNNQWRCSSQEGQLAGIAHLLTNGYFSQPCAVDGRASWGRYLYSCPRISDGLVMSVAVESEVVRPGPTWPASYVNSSPGTDDVPVSDDQLGDSIRQNPQLVNDLLTDPRTGRPVMTPELQQQGEQLKREIEQREGLPTSDPSPAPNLEDDTPKDEGSPWPSFCSWATPVCDFIEWFKGPGDPDVDLPEREIQLDQDGWSSGVGGGSCPQAQEFSVDLVGTTGRASFDFQPLCSFATTMRPVLIAVCALIAAFILAGLRSSGGGRS